MLLMGVYSAFYYATLQEWYVGSLDLPPCNGVSDGSFIIMSGYILSGIFGAQFYAVPLFDASWLGWTGVTDITIGQLSMTMVATINLIMAAQFVIGIVKSKWKPFPTQVEQWTLF
jgi:hypothetical protein